MTKKKAAVWVAITFPLWLTFALAIKDWPRGIYLWPVVVLGGLAVARLTSIAVAQEPPNQTSSGGPVSAPYDGPTSRPGPRHRNW
jgi:hypothetical protein